MHFSNNSNRDFYEKIDIEKFRGFAQIIGLQSGADVAAILPFLFCHKSVVELGSGYGRAVECLLQMGYRGHITAVERIPHLCSYMQRNFGDSTSILEQDLKFLNLPAHTDCMLWLWSGIMEISPNELLPVLRNLRQQLIPGGTIFIETPEKIQFIGQQLSNRFISYNTDWGHISAYFPEKSELKTRLHQAGFTSVRVFSYPVTYGRRVFYMAS